jgi:hypothetical protein
MVGDNCENLRSKNVLNPTSDGDAMSQPARMMVLPHSLLPSLLLSLSLTLCPQLNGRPDCCLSLYSELRESPVYQEYVIFAFLACPGLIFHPEAKYTEIFRMVMTDHLVLNVFRDTVRPSSYFFLSSFFAFPPSFSVSLLCLSPSSLHLSLTHSLTHTHTHTHTLVIHPRH